VLFLTFGLNVRLVNTAYSQSVDCDQMVSDCKKDNPYHWLVLPEQHDAWDAGCEKAGKYCKQQKGIYESEGIKN